MLEMLFPFFEELGLVLIGIVLLSAGLVAIGDDTVKWGLTSQCT